MSEDIKTVGVTGLRPQKLPWGTGEDNPQCQALKDTMGRALNKFYHQGYRRFATGMALGPDIWFAEEVLFLPDPKELYCFIPYRGQENGWNPEDQDRYRDILHEADKVIVAGSGYTPNIMFERNKMMVDASDMIIAVWDSETTGGTYSTIRYARQNNKPILQLNPNDFWGVG